MITDVLASLQNRALGAWRFRITAIAIAWIVAIIGWGIVITLPDSYESRARVYVDTESVLKPLLAGLAVGSDVMNQVNMMGTVLFSRPNLAKVARETDLHLRAQTPEEFEALITGLQKRIALTPTRDNTYTITFADSDRATAERVVRTLLNTFVEDTLGIKREDNTGAQRFLEQQLADYEQRLREAEERLAEFKKKNLGLMPGEQGDYYTRLSSNMTRLAKLQDDYRSAAERRSELQKQLEGEEPVIGFDPGDQQRRTFSPLDTKIAEHKARLDGLLLQFTEKHPEVITLRETIGQLEAQRDADIARRGGATTLASANPLNQNPVYQNMKIALSRTEVEIAQLRAEMSGVERDIGALKSRVDTIPEVEAQLSRLNRDYDVNKAQHTALLQRLESARLSQEAERSTEDVRFRIIEPPTTPLRPTGPNRPLFLSFVLVLSLGLAGATAFLLNELRPVFLSRSTLRQVTSLPVIGVVGLVRRPGEMLPPLDRPILAVGAAAALFVAFGVVVALASMVSGGA
jgi:polysaccharide chain length determinant protein (PEP-CTERM system associated)